MRPGRLFRSALLVTVWAVLAGCKDDAPVAGDIVVPSGRALSLIEVITNAPGPEGATARFRFLAPGLKPDDVVAAAEDMQALCESYARPRISGMVPMPQQIIISLSAEDVPFGTPAPEIVQFFEAYSLRDGACIWEQF